MNNAPSSVETSPVKNQGKKEHSALYRSTSTPLRLKQEDGFSVPSNGAAVGPKITPDFLPELLGGNVVSTSI